MKKVGLFSVGLFFMAMSVLGAQEMKLGYVDVEKVFNEYEVTKQNDAKLKEEGKAKTAERTALVDEIKKLKDESELLSEDARKEKDAVIEQKLKALRDFDEKTKNELRNKRDFLLKKIFDDIRVTIEEVGKAEGYSLIFNDRALLFKTESYDITNLVIQKVNEKAKAESEKKAKEAPAEAQP